MSKAVLYNPWRIHGAGIYAHMTGVYWWDPCYIYGSTMDPSWAFFSSAKLLVVSPCFSPKNSFSIIPNLVEQRPRPSSSNGGDDLKHQGDVKVYRQIYLIYIFSSVIYCYLYCYLFMLSIVVHYSYIYIICQSKTMHFNLANCMNHRAALQRCGT